MKIENKICKCCECGKEFQGNNIFELMGHSGETPCPECAKKREEAAEAEMDRTMR